MKKILIIDTNNIFWLSRGPHTHESSLNGGWPITSQFFIILNSYLRIHEPDSVFLLGEGYPKWRYEKFEYYKVGRPEARSNDPLNEDFSRQKKDTRKAIKEMLPIYFLGHEFLEADDIANVICEYINKNNIESEIVLISTDKDWEQNMVLYDNVSIWQPMTKKWKEKPDEDFIKIKAICGDNSDGIIGFKGIGPKTAKKIISDEKKWEEWNDSLTEEQKKQFEKNLYLIDFKNIPDIYKNEVFKMIDEFDFPDLQWEKFRIYCASRKMFQFLKKFDDKILFYKKLKPIIKHKVVNKNIFEV